MPEIVFFLFYQQNGWVRVQAMSLHLTVSNQKAWLSSMIFDRTIYNLLMKNVHSEFGPVKKIVRTLFVIDFEEGRKALQQQEWGLRTVRPFDCFHKHQPALEQSFNSFQI